MSNDRPGRSKYRIFSRVLARKGNAQPLSATGNPLVLAAENHRVPTDDEHLVEAVTDTTLEILTEPPARRRIPKGAAPLTDLFDPAMTRPLRRESKDFEG